MPAVKNSKMTSAKPATNRKYATHGVPSVCASCCPRSSLLKRTSWFGCRLRSLPSPITSAVSSDDVLRRRPCTVCPSSETMKSPTVGWTAFDDVESLGVLGRQPAIRRPPSTFSVLRPLAACASRTCVRPPRRATGPTCRRSSPDTPDRCPRPARRRRSAALSASNALAPRASAPEGPIHTPIGTVRVRDQVDERVDVGVDGTGARELDDEQRRVVGLGLVHDPRRAARRWPGRAGRRPARPRCRSGRPSASSLCAAAGCANASARPSRTRREQQADSCTGG